MKDANDTIAKKEHDNRRQEALLQEVGSKANTVNEKVRRCPRCCHPALSRAFVALKALLSLDDKHTALMEQLHDLAALASRVNLKAPPVFCSKPLVGF